MVATNYFLVLMCSQFGRATATLSPGVPVPGGRHCDDEGIRGFLNMAGVALSDSDSDFAALGEAVGKSRGQDEEAGDEDLVVTNVRSGFFDVALVERFIGWEDFRR